MVASKYLFDDGEDEEVFNDEWATSGSLDLKDLNRLEREFLSAMEWNLYVTPEAFFAQLTTIETLVTWNQTRKRVPHGFTYNEIVALAFDHKNLPEWFQLSDNFLKMILVTSATYSAIVLSVFGATLIACSFQVMLANSLAPYTISTNNTESNSDTLSNAPLLNLIASSNFLSIGKPLLHKASSLGLFDGNHVWKQKCQIETNYALPRLVSSYFNVNNPPKKYIQADSRSRNLDWPLQCQIKIS